MGAGSTSPPAYRGRNADRYSPEFDNSRVPTSHSRGFGRGREIRRYRDYSPPSYGRGRDGGRFGGRFGRGYGGPGPFRGEGGGGMPRSSPNVRPREGDWICPDPSCNNLNFARREYCNNCKRPRYGGGGGGRGGYLMPPPPPRRFPGPPPPPRRFPGSPPPPRRFPGPISPPRRFPRSPSPLRRFPRSPSPPRRFPRSPSLPRRFPRPPPPPPLGDRSPPRRFPPDEHQMHRDYLGDEEGGFRGERFDRSPPPVADYRGKDNSPIDRKGREVVVGYQRRQPSLSPPRLPPPPPPPMHGGGGARWGSRERSRSPLFRGAKGGDGSPTKDYRRDMYVERGRDDRRGPPMTRDRIHDDY